MELFTLLPSDLPATSFSNKLIFLLLIKKLSILYPSVFLSPEWSLDLILALLLGRTVTEEHQRHSELQKRRIVDTDCKR